MNDMAYQRHAGIELFRIVMMFGICMVHACRQGQFARHDAFTAILCASVVGFIFISGYFGVNFKLSKVIEMYLLSFFYCSIVPIIGGGYKDGYVNAVFVTWGAQWRFWFLHAYVILLAISPMINCVFKTSTESQRMVVEKALPILFVVFVWGWLTSFPSLDMIVPRPAGMTGTGFLTMLGIYVAARLFKICEIEKRFSLRSLLMWLFLTLGIYCLLGQRCSPYMCPVAFVLVAILFCLFKRIRLYGKIGKVILWISPSMFGIYILNATLYLPGMSSNVYGLLNAVRDPLLTAGIKWHLACLIAASSAFFLSLLVDVVRRLVLCRVTLKKALLDQKLNELYDYIVEKFARL